MDLNQRALALWHRIAGPPRDIAVTIVLLWAAYMISGALLGHTGAENNSALVFVLAVVLISVLTNRYFFGIMASLVGGFCVNYFFMYPYSQFSLSVTGYPVAMLSMIIISIIVCALTTRAKLMAEEAVKREQDAKALYELNQRANKEKAALQLEAARESIRGNILRSVSHDLRTPLTAISGAIAVLMESSDTSPKNMALLADIKDDADAMITMVENILSVTRIQDGTMPLKKRDEMLEEVAGDAVMATHRRFPDANVSLELSEDILYLPMDPMLVKQVIVNLLENAIRHSGDTQTITLRLLRQEDWAVVEVRDHGRGLDPDLIELIQAGQQLPAEASGDSSRGMGIGLSVCQSIVKAHGGFFEAGNAPEGGAVFRFGLPMEEKDNG